MTLRIQNADNLKRLIKSIPLIGPTARKLAQLPGVARSRRLAFLRLRFLLGSSVSRWRHLGSRFLRPARGVQGGDLERVCSGRRTFAPS